MRIKPRKSECYNPPCYKSAVMLLKIDEQCNLVIMKYKTLLSRLVSLLLLMLSTYTSSPDAGSHCPVPYNN